MLIFYRALLLTNTCRLETKRRMRKPAVLATKETLDRQKITLTSKKIRQRLR